MFWVRKPTEDDILAALQKVIDPQDQRDIVSSGWVNGIAFDQKRVVVTLNVDPARGKILEDIRQRAENAVALVKGVKEARVVLTAEREGVPSTEVPARQILPEVRHVIAVASGKGGVGKSTVAANLAMALQQQGLRVGILDADVYGPSMPMLLGVRHEKPVYENDMLVPIRAHGLSVMSMGFMVDEARAMVWRGPMIQKALTQLLRDVRWGALDVLIIDMPPGTGDAQLTLAQKVPLSGAVIVSTPQDIALLDAVKGVAMFQKTDVPILGLIENMSFFCCPNCDHETPIFGRHGAEQRAQEMEIPFLGALPLDVAMREHADSGVPIVSAMPESDSARRFKSISAHVMHMLDGVQK